MLSSVGSVTNPATSVLTSRIFLNEQRNERCQCTAVQVVLGICVAGMNEVSRPLEKRRKMIIAGDTELEQHSRATEAFGSDNNTEYFLSGEATTLRLSSATITHEDVVFLLS